MLLSGVRDTGCSHARARAGESEKPGTASPAAPEAADAQPLRDNSRQYQKHVVVSAAALPRFNSTAIGDLRQLFAGCRVVHRKSCAGLCGDPAAVNEGLLAKEGGIAQQQGHRLVSRLRVFLD
jgi:hypothetical protein